MKKLVWSRLKNFRCPKCNGSMTTAKTGTRAVGCEDEEGCGFYMRQEVFDRVVKNLYQTKPGYKPKFGDDVENLELLNNLNRGVVPEGYKDMVFLNPDDDTTNTDTSTRSKCCGARMVAGGVQCEACGSNGE